MAGAYDSATRPAFLYSGSRRLARTIETCRIGENFGRMGSFGGACVASDPIIDEVRRLKQQMRIEASQRRANQPDAEGLSRQIFERLTALPEYARTRTLMLYLDVRSEVRTRWFVPTAWGDGKRVVVPYCENGQIELFQLQSFDDLLPATMGVLEPKPELRRRPDRRVDPDEPDLVVTPGLAFDRTGGRLGYGKGYYDRFLHQIRGDAMKLAVCFECQLFPEIPVLPHDIRVDLVVTENAVYPTND
jgi:5-formyltetrahydrofolate cyclo-ligase